MNMKFIAGVSFASIAAAAFWACGEGNINEMTDDDGIFGLRTPEEWVGLKEQAIKSCEQDELGCKLMYGDYLADPNAPVEEDTPTSSASQGSQGGTTQSNPSQGGPDITITDPPPAGTSSATIIDDPGISSSSVEVEVVTGLGSCKPLTTPIDKGKTVVWQFVANPAKYASGEKYTQMDFIQRASYAWTFRGEGVTPATGTGTKSPEITYANSGKFGASVDVTMPDGATETIECSTPLQVNGDPITGCVCTTEATSVDYTVTPDIAWSVSGCVTASLPLKYEWDGVAGEASYSKNFTAAQDGYAPTLKVGNSDNTEITVTCPAVKTTKGAEYPLEIVDNQLPNGAVEVANEGCVNVSGSWNNTYDAPNLKLDCQLQVNGGTGLSLNLTYNGEKVSKTGDYNVQASVELGAVKQGTLDYAPICITFTGAGAEDKASCKLGR